jgi:hypothetical protein
VGVVGKVIAACLLAGALVGLALGDASTGANVGAAVGLVLITTNVVISVHVIRWRFDPERARAEGERLGRLAQANDDDV